MIPFEVTILGSNSALFAHGRHPTSQVIRYNEHFFLADCGEGTQLRLSDTRIKRSKIHHIFISHLHGDHYFGLPGLLTSFHLQKRSEPIHLYGPKGLDEILQLTFRHSETKLLYELVFHPIETSQNQVIWEDEQLSISTLPMKHRIACCGFLFREKQNSLKVRKESIEKFALKPEHIRMLKAGKNVKTESGKVIRPEDVGAPAAQARSYAMASDTLYNEELIPRIAGADLLYHESTFMEESAERAALTFHCTARQAATLAKKAGVKKLLLGHFSARYSKLEEMLAEAREVFENCEIAVELKQFSVGEETAIDH